MCALDVSPVCTVGHIVSIFESVQSMFTTNCSETILKHSIDTPKPISLVLDHLEATIVRVFVDSIQFQSHQLSPLFFVK